MMRAYELMVIIDGDETLWYAPGFGPVRELTHEEDFVDERVADYDEWFYGFEDFD